MATTLIVVELPVVGVTYSPPPGDDIILNFQGVYTPPAGNAIVLEFFD